MRILIATDAFPPVCGGSGWSTFELARGLRARGHRVVLCQPKPGRAPGSTVDEYDGFRIWQLGARAPNIPYVRNYFKNERLSGSLQLLLDRIIREEEIEIVHGQHVLTCPPAVLAARRARVPVVCTVRDYWPVCYWSDLILDFGSGRLCPACSTAGMTRCVRPRAGAAWPLALPFVPYMQANLARKRAALAAASAIIAVSTTIAADVRDRAPELAERRIEVIPNPVDVAGIVGASEGHRPIDGPYALYAGKLAPNKGVQWLVAALAETPPSWPCVVVGDGPERARLEREARERGRPFHFTGWLPRPEVLCWVRHAAVLVFPSLGPESLSRVLLEASALGTAIAAMDTGGTRDIITHGQSGLLSSTPEALARDVGQLSGDPSLRARLGDAARQTVESRFDAPGVVGRIEALYRDLLRDRP